MKKSRLLLVYLLVMALFVVSDCSAASSRIRTHRSERSKQRPPETVLDYFLLLPDKWSDVTPAERHELLSGGGSVLDVRHDYLLMHGDGAQATVNVVLFRHAGQVTVAVLNGGYDPPIPTLRFLRYGGGVWTDITKQVLPADAWPDAGDYFRLVYQLPRSGTTIRVLNSVGTSEYDLAWQGGRFILRRPR